MNREAIRWIDKLEKQEIDENGNEVFNWKVRKEIFAMAQDWLIRSRKLWPDAGNEEEGEGITSMRDWMNDPKNLDAMDALMEARGYVKVPEKKVGRPKKSEAEVRARVKSAIDLAKSRAGQDDDSGLQALMRGKIPGERPQ